MKIYIQNIYTERTFLLNMYHICIIQLLPARLYCIYRATIRTKNQNKHAKILSGLAAVQPLERPGRPCFLHHINFRSNKGPIVSVGVQKLYGPEISLFLPCMLQFLDDSRWLFFFSNYTRGINYVMLDFLKRSDT